MLTSFNIIGASPQTVQHDSQPRKRDKKRKQHVVRPNESYVCSSKEVVHTGITKFS